MLRAIIRKRIIPETVLCINLNCHFDFVQLAQFVDWTTGTIEADCHNKRVSLPNSLNNLLMLQGVIRYTWLAPQISFRYILFWLMQKTYRLLSSNFCKKFMCIISNTNYAANLRLKTHRQIICGNSFEEIGKQTKHHCHNCISCEPPICSKSSL